MIRDYSTYVARRWSELSMSAKIKATPDNEEAQKPVQCEFLIQIASELFYSTMHEGRTHPDVRLLHKDSGNFYESKTAGKIATDRLCICDTNESYTFVDERKVAIVDCIITSLRHIAHPGWINNGIIIGGDLGKVFVPPKLDPRDAIVDILDPKLPGDETKPIDETPSLLRQILLEEKAQTAELIGIRKDLTNLGVKLIESGKLGDLLGGLFK